MPSPPYMYDPPQRYSATSDTLYGFDPKAVTKASRMPPRSPPKKQDGPLVDFNKHPDSYLVLPNGRSNVKPMNPRVKVAIKWVRWVQLGFRVLQLIGAIGLLICVICIKGTQDTEGWIIRIPVGSGGRISRVVDLFTISRLLLISFVNSTRFTTLSAPPRAALRPALLATTFSPSSSTPV